MTIVFNMKKELRDYSLKNKNEEPTADPHIMLESISNSLADNGGLKDGHECEIILNVMKCTTKLVPKFICIYVLQSSRPEILESFVKIGGWSILNKYLCDAKDATNAPLLIELMKVIEKVPIKIAHLKENNTAKVVKTLSKSSNTVIKTSAAALMDKFMNVIHGNSNNNNVEVPAKKLKHKERTKTKSKDATKHENTKSTPVMKPRTKFRKTGFEEEPDQPPKKKSKPPGRIPSSGNPGRIPVTKEAVPHLEKKKPTVNHEKIEKQKKITMSGGFMDALNCPATIPQKRIKRKISRNNSAAPGNTTPNHTSTTAEIHRTDPEPVTPEPVEPVEPSKPRLNRFGKPMKSVSWCSEDKLTAVRYFEIHENERVNVSTQNFKDKMLREHMFERQHIKGKFNDEKEASDSSWKRPPLIDLPESLIVRGCNSIEKDVQREREKSVLQIFLLKDSIPDTPTEPDPEPYEVVQPTIIPLVDENSTEEDTESRNVLSTVNDNSQTNTNSNVGDLKEKLKEILQTASAITPDNGSYPPQPDYPHPPMPMYNQPPPPPMGIPPMGMPQQGYYPPQMMMQPMYQQQNWQQQNYQMPPQRPQYQPYNNNNQPRWQGHRGRPRHAR